MLFRSFLPVLPLFGGGLTAFQPVYVGDVAMAVLHAATRSDTLGMTYGLGGPEILGFRECLKRLLKITHQRVIFLSLSWGIAQLLAWPQKILPRPLFTGDQLRLLKTSSNIVPQGAPGLHALGVTPTALDTILPTYLAAYRPGGCWALEKSCS